MNPAQITEITKGKKRKRQDELFMNLKEIHRLRELLVNPLEPLEIRIAIDRIWKLVAADHRQIASFDAIIEHNEKEAQE
jgi:hypothetical protein